MTQAVAVDGAVLGPGFWITSQGLALMVAEIEAGEKREKALKRQITLYKSIPCPEIPEDHTPFNWGDLALSAGIGAGVAVLTIGIIGFTK